MNSKHRQHYSPSTNFVIIIFSFGQHSSSTYYNKDVDKADTRYNFCDDDDDDDDE